MPISTPCWTTETHASSGPHVVRYAFPWSHEQAAAKDEGLKDRPCAVLLSARTSAGGVRVYVLPITHRPPDEPGGALEIPATVKRHIGLDSARSWIVLDEVNDFIWPGFDLRAIPGSEPAHADYGVLPPGFFRRVRDAFIDRYRGNRVKIAPRD